MRLDGLSYRDRNNQATGPRSFADETGYCNPEYTDEMMSECVHQCMDALIEGD